MNQRPTRPISCTTTLKCLGHFNSDTSEHRPIYRVFKKCQCTWWLYCNRQVHKGLWARTACSFRSAQTATLLKFMYHSRIVLSVGGSVWYMIRNLRCTVTIDSVLANSKTQNAFLFTVNVIFRHDYPLAVEPGSTPRPLVQKKLGEILYLLICSFLPCLSWLLRSRVRKSRRDLWITLYKEKNSASSWLFTRIIPVARSAEHKKCSSKLTVKYATYRTVQLCGNSLILL